MNAPDPTAELPVSQNNIDNVAPVCNNLYNPSVTTDQGSVNTSGFIQPNPFASNIGGGDLNRGHYEPQNAEQTNNSLIDPNAASNYQMINNVPVGYGFSNMLPNNAFVTSYPSNNSYVLGEQIPNNNLPVHDPNNFEHMYAPQQVAPNNMYINPQMQYMGNQFYPNDSSNIMNNSMYGYPNVQNSDSQIALFVDSATGMQYIGEKVGDKVTFTPHPAQLTPQFVPIQNTQTEPIEVSSNMCNIMPPNIHTIVPKPISPSIQTNSPRKGKKMIYRNSNRTILPADDRTRRNTESLLVPVEPTPHVRKVRKKIVPNHSNNCTRALLPAKRNKFEIGPEIICWTCMRTFENDIDRFQEHTCIKATKEKRSYCSRCFNIFLTVAAYYNHTCMTSDHLYNCNLCDGRFKNVELLSKHSELHTQFLVYNCRVCSLGFHSQTLLENHMNIHKNSKYLTQYPSESETYVYACTTCAIPFSSRDLYDNHMVSIHNLNTQHCKPTVVPPSLQMQMAQNPSQQIQSGQISHPQLQDTSMINYQQLQNNPYLNNSNIMYNGVVMSDETVMYNTNPVPVPASDGNTSLSINSAMIGSTNPSQVGTISDTSLVNNSVVSEVSKTSALISGDDANTNQQHNEIIFSKDMENTCVNNSCDNINSQNNSIISNENSSTTDYMTAQTSSNVNTVPKEGENHPMEGLSQFEFFVQNTENGLLNQEYSHSEAANNEEYDESMEQIDSNQFSCNICHITFQNTRYLSEHLCTKVSHNCGYCGRIFSGKYASRKYLKHLEIHPSELTFSCPLCPQKFRTSRQLKFHSKKHYYASKSYCNLCNLSFKTSEALILHDKIHKNMKPCFTCPVCNAKFIYERTLNKHLKDIHHARIKKQKEVEEECVDDVE